MGEIHDRTTEGDLALLVTKRLKEHFGGALLMTRACAGLPTLKGDIRIRRQPGAIAFDASRQVSGQHQGLELRLQLVDRDQHIRWDSGFVEGRAIWLRGATVLDTRGTQRRGRKAILDELVDDLAMRFSSLQPMEESP